MGIEIAEHGTVTLVTFDGQVSEEAYTSYLLRMSQRLDTGTSVAAIVDAARSQAHALGNIKLQAAWLKKHRAQLNQLDFSTALVITQPVVRFALSAMLAISPIPGEYAATGTLAEACDWVRARLASQGRSTPSTIIAIANKGRTFVESTRP